MNKKQKILTAVALAVFGVIIIMHCTDTAGHWQMYYHFIGPGHNRLYSGARPVLEDVFGPLFVLAVFYVGLFFILHDKKTR
jgi:hypothetical protein